MSASILWEPVSRNPGHINAMAPSSFMEAMAKAGFALPCVLGKKDWDKLNAMAAVYGDRDNNPFRQLADVIMDSNVDIRVWAEY